MPKEKKKTKQSETGGVIFLVSSAGTSNHALLFLWTLKIKTTQNINFGVNEVRGLGQTLEGSEGFIKFCIYMK